MNNDAPLPPRNVTELLKNPQRVQDAFALLDLLANPRVIITTPALAGGMSQLKIGENSATLALALCYPAGVPSALAGGATLAEVIAKVNLILVGETAIQSNPKGA